MKKCYLLLLTTFTVIVSHLFHTARGIISYFIFSGVNLIFLQESGLTILHFYQVNAAVRRHTSMPEMFRILVQVLEKSPHCTSMGRHQNRFVCQRRIWGFSSQNSLVRSRTSWIFSPFSGRENSRGSLKTDQILRNWIPIVFPFLIMCLPEPQN